MSQELFTSPKITDNIQPGTNAAICYNFLNDNYRLRYNIITGNVEDKNVSIEGKYKVIADRELNTMYIKLTSRTAKPPSKEFLYTFISSDFIEMYNPFEDFFNEHSGVNRSAQLITDLANTIETDTVNAEKYIKHWGCGMIASIYGSQSPLTLVLAGEKLNTGKTEWFRRLLPKELKQYYAESNLDGGKDDDILMCRKLIIMDDEFGGKSKKDQRHFKGLTSRQNKEIRAHYARSAVEMRRICSLCGTSNELELLSDPYGNRRILPINVLSIDHDRYNAIDKTALIMAFYDLYKTGFYWKFKQEDILQLNEASDEFHATNMEAELIDEWFQVPNNEYDGDYMTNTAIKDYLETRTKQKIWNSTKLGIELKNIGFRQKQKKINKINQRVYLVKLKKEPSNNVPDLNQPATQLTEPQTNNLPF